ncbi:MAG: hydrogenase 4 subunit F [Candidatus Omnitrophota bacterium]
MDIIVILVIQLLLAVSPTFFGKHRNFGYFNAAGYLLSLIYSLCLALSIAKGVGVISLFNFFYIDALSAYFILTISLINFASSVYSIKYISGDVEEGEISASKAVKYYSLFNLFALSMYFVTVVNNLGMVWVAIEMTTLVSAFLVGFHNNKMSIEAAWKYIIICSAGITLALLGTILFYYTASRDGGVNSLNWTDMMSVARKMDPRMLKIAFLFIIVGYGTKAGLVPMHTWLPDAHSQSPAPISALLSGVLLKTAIYAILRYTAIINKCVAVHYSSNLFIFFGLLSLGISAGFILVQKDLKRLLAYSSVEHIGVIATGLGFGGAAGLYGALFHVFNHAVNKSLMFFGAGYVVKKYKTGDMNVIRGVMGTMPFIGTVLILGAFALGGSPPFSIFVSEIMVIIAGFRAGAYLPAVLALFFLAVIFGSLIYHFSRIVFGKRPQDMQVSACPFSMKFISVFLFIFICIMGFKMPWFFNKLLVSAGNIIRGV